MTALLDLVAADIGAPPRRVSIGKNGAEYAGPCPSCGGRDRFHVWPEEIGGKAPGRWWCRGCGKKGDAIAYLTGFRGMSFPDACAQLGVDIGRTASAPRLRRRERPAPDPLAARETVAPPELWQVRAAKLVDWAEARLWSDAGEGARSYLAGRGLTEYTMRRHRLGWISESLLRDRATWGLPEELREDGTPRKLLIPPGVLIPCLEESGRVLRLRVRYWTSEHGSTPPREQGQDKAPPKYRNVGGSAMRALVCGEGRAAVVVESDLDALLLAQEAGDLVVPVALGSVDVRPDARAAELLRAAPVVLVALDTDDAGGRATWGKWIHAENVLPWPVPSKYGKDPGEARGNGLNLRNWILAGLQYVGGASVAIGRGAPADPPGPLEDAANTRPVLSLPDGSPATPRLSTAASGTLPDPAQVNPFTEYGDGRGTPSGDSGTEPPSILDLREDYEERAAIRQYDGGYCRPEAEQLAAADMAEKIDRWVRIKRQVAVMLQHHAERPGDPLAAEASARLPLVLAEIEEAERQRDGILTMAKPPTIEPTEEELYEEI